MKKLLKVGAIALCATSIFSFSACASTPTGEKNIPYWLSNPANEDMITNSGRTETLNYDVTLSQATTPNKNYTLRATGANDKVGTYETTLTVTNTNGIDGVKSDDCYCLTTELTMDSYKYVYVDDENEEHTYSVDDSVTSKVYFKQAGKKLLPIYSEKTVRSTSPLDGEINSIDDCFKVYEYTVTATYNDNATKVTYTYKEKDATTEKKKTVSLSSATYFADNEQLYFSLRSLPLTSSFNLSTFNPYTAKQESLSVSVAKAQDGTMNFNGADNDLRYIDVRIGRNALISGTKQIARFATEKTDGNNFRHVMLSLQSQLPYQLGTFHYTLTSATFMA